MCFEVCEGVWMCFSTLSGALVSVLRCLRVSWCVIVCLEDMRSQSQDFTLQDTRPE